MRGSRGGCRRRGQRELYVCKLCSLIVGSKYVMEKQGKRIRRERMNEWRKEGRERKKLKFVESKQGKLE